MLGSILEKEELGGGFRVVRAVEGWLEMLGVWVDLGTELGVVLLRMEALVRVERKRRKRAVFCRGEDGE